MRKQDDDLKIDISDLFGGDVPAPPPTGAAAAEPAAPTQEQENEFQEWMSARNEALEAKTLELERKLHENSPEPFPQGPDDQLPTTEEAPAAVPEAPPVVEEAPVAPPAPATPESPIDFNAPITPPFMGGPAPAAATPAPAPEAAAPAETVAQTEEELKRLQADHEFMLLYDEFRNIILFEIKDLVGERKANTMLSRTVEMAREKFPEIFRNANWDAAGNLLADGSMDHQRLIDNKNALGPGKANEVLDTALGTLLRLRMQAVEKGLGAGLKNKIRARMYQWISEKGKRASQDGKPPALFQRLSAYVTAI